MLRKSISSLAVAAAGFALLDPTPAVSGWDYDGNGNGNGPPSWTGFYVGPTFGAQWQEVDYDNPNFNGTSSSGGLTIGLVGGYNWHLSQRWIIGVEGSWNASTLDYSKRFHGTDLTTSTDWEADVRLRLGYLIKMQKIVYLAVGLAYAQQQVAFPNIDETRRRTGFTVAFGVEKGDFLPGLHGGIELKYTNYGERDFFGDLPTGLASWALVGRVTTKPVKVAPPRWIP